MPLVDPGQRIGDVRDVLVGRRDDSAGHIVVCEAGLFRGVVTMEDVLCAPAEATVESVMDSGAPIVGPGSIKRWLATVVQDLLSIWIYLAVTSLVMS
jgi:CBS domain-containing protein